MFGGSDAPDTNLAPSFVRDAKPKIKQELKKTKPVVNPILRFLSDENSFFFRKLGRGRTPKNFQPTASETLNGMLAKSQRQLT